VALKAIPAGRFGVLVSVEPAVGALAGAVLLGEHLAAPQVLAIALVVLASVGSVIASERERAGRSKSTKSVEYSRAMAHGRAQQPPYRSHRPCHPPCLKAPRSSLPPS
jgi:hypothetical protein